MWNLTSRQLIFFNDSASIPSGCAFLGETCSANCPYFCWSNWQSALSYRWTGRQTSSLITNGLGLWWWKISVRTVGLLACSLINFCLVFYFKLIMLNYIADLRLALSDVGFFMLMSLMTVSWFSVSLSWPTKHAPVNYMEMVVLCCINYSDSWHYPDMVGWRTSSIRRVKELVQVITHFLVGVYNHIFLSAAVNILVIIN